MTSEPQQAMRAGHNVAPPTTKPILFSGPMVRAILAGTKTQTRRALSPQPQLAVMDADSARALRDAQELGLVPQPGTPRWRWRGTFYMPWPQCIRNDSPYGMPGDRLWVRETWCAPTPVGRDVVYRADLDASQLREEREARRVMRCPADAQWRPSIFMPRWASRITLEVIDVRVERVQDISAEDSLAEGVPRASECGCEVCRHSAQMCPADAGEQVLAYAALWDSINGKRPGCAWADNPYVWVICFRRVVPDGQ